MNLPPNTLRVSDRSCVVCSGEVELFVVVDKVWKALQLGENDWICVNCFARRLSPAEPATSLEDSHTGFNFAEYRLLRMV